MKFREFAVINEWVVQFDFCRQPNGAEVKGTDIIRMKVETAR